MSNPEMGPRDEENNPDDSEQIINFEEIDKSDEQEEKRESRNLHEQQNRLNRNVPLAGSPEALQAEEFRAEETREQLRLRIYEQQTNNLEEGKFFDPVEIDGKKYPSVYDQFKMEVSVKSRFNNDTPRDIEERERNRQALGDMLKIMEEAQPKKPEKKYGPIEKDGVVTIEEIKDVSQRDNSDLDAVKKRLEQLYSDPEIIVDKSVQAERPIESKIENMRMQTMKKREEQISKAKEELREKLKNAKPKIIKWWEFWK